MHASLPMLRFCRDVLIGCLTLAIAWGGGTLLLRVMPDLITTILNFSGTLGILTAFGIFVPPLTLIVMGVARKRSGLVVSPLLAAGIPAAVLVWSGYQQMLEVRNVEQRAFLKPEAKHDVVMLPSHGCGIACMQVLAETHYSVVGHEPSSNTMTLYRKASGDVCYRPDNVTMLVKFTRAGYAGLCTVQSPIKNVEDALILERLTAKSATSISLPSRYDGDLYSFIERTGGKDRLLGRWAGGNVKAITEFPIGPRFNDLDFYGAALGVRLTNNPVFGHDDLEVRAEKLRPVLKLQDLQPEAAWAYGDLLDQLRKRAAVSNLQEPLARAPATPGETGTAEQASR
ncbi:hypothetical protein [Dongia sedimenti]|uniref:Uncharacterized protein n=1 Tax=Dongia sedimenti TaxID=3064282 RepID=A0ABU0YMD2_9PROT|nr:hypothetical protein [Rhodospirillaceae bacterium R-7]